ncbi:cytochrome c maturation protein CcmE [Paraneptunicella aestuarii]|uniref:cytochrome c maturation protein CcmE n=1 Tax=Paraneptunicella aestuarii TaxID=2831148 RepID=UPI001E2F5277|nr:cytochrome c maturation protein CcmE [Paraneptunicella aestuarii]UAA38133.1 cytochrome c maturation protein CcmE [Paraneptunicella aestuarii]
MHPRRKKRLFAVSAVIVIVTAAIGLMLYALNQNIDLFYTPSEIVNGKNGVKPSVGQRLRIGGMVVEGSVQRSHDSLDVEFDLIDVGPLVKVTYHGILPDLFREGQGIVATGVLQEGNLIVADEVLAKHDEEYMPPELAEAMKGIKHEKPSQYQQYNKPEGE